MKWALGLLVVFAAGCERPVRSDVTTPVERDVFVPRSIRPLGGKVAEAFALSKADRQRPGETVSVALNTRRERRDAVVLNVAKALLTASAGTRATVSYSPLVFARTPPAECSARLAFSWGASVDLPVSGPDTSAAQWRSATVERPRDGFETLAVEVQLEKCPGGQWGVALGEVELTGAASSPPPNVIAIVVDTLRADDFACDALTAQVAPNLYELVCQRGTYFEEAISTSSWTYPAMASMLTGRWPREHGGVRRGGREYDVDRHTPMVQEELGAAGYDTFALVANPVATRGLWRGFDRFASLRWHDGDHSTRAADALIDRAIGWLDARAGHEPFFLWTVFMDVHEPADAALMAGDAPESCASLDPVPLWWRSLQDATYPPSAQHEALLECKRDLYRQCITWIDRHVGRLLRYVDLDETAVLLVSDHGEAFFDHLEEEWTWMQADPKAWRRKKQAGVGHGQSMYRELTHVPLVVALPAGADPTPGRRSSALVSVADVYATVLDLGRVARPGGSPSRSLLPLALDPSLAGRAVARSENVLYGPNRVAITAPNLKAIQTGVELEVYDRRADPTEQEPLAEDHPLVRRARQLLREQTRGVSRETEPDARDIDALRAMGYVE